MAEKHMTNVRLAKIIGVNQNSISRIANNRSQPTISDLFAIAEALECEPGELLRSLSEAKGE